MEIICMETNPVSFCLVQILNGSLVTRLQIWIGLPSTQKENLGRDLEYPDNIHDKTQDFPLAPESDIVTEDMLTPYMSDLWNARCELRSQAESFKPEKKLLMTCRNKKEYVVHLNILKFYINMGMRITSIHKVVWYNQAAIFKDYINDNSAKRQAATSEFEKDLYKLLNNALFGKTMENVRGRKKYHLRNSKESILKDTSKPQYLCSHRFAEYLVLNELMNLEVKLNKSIFIGQAVLGLSKLTMFELRYRKFPAYEAEFGARITRERWHGQSLLLHRNNETEWAAAPSYSAG